MRNIAMTAAALIALAGCRTATVGTSPGMPAPAPPPPAGSMILPAGTIMELDLDQTLSTEDNRVGDRFTATVDDPVRRADGTILVPENSVVHGVITGLDDSDRAGDQAAIRLNFTHLNVRGVNHPFSAEIIGVDVDPGDLVRISDVRRDVAIGAATGAVLGAIIGGDLADILIGGALGAGAGTIVSLGRGEFRTALPRGTDLTVRTTQQVSLR